MTFHGTSGDTLINITGDRTENTCYNSNRNAKMIHVLGIQICFLNLMAGESEWVQHPTAHLGQHSHTEDVLEWAEVFPPPTYITHLPHINTHIMQEIHPYTTMVLILRTCTLEWLPSNRHFIHMWVLKLMRSKQKCTCISVLPCSEDMFMIESVIPIIRLNLWNLCISSFTEHEALHPKHHSPSRIRTTALCYK